MTPLPLHSWHERAGATFAERAGHEVVAHYGDPGAEYAAARSAAVRVDLSFREALRITGEDRVSFLHGMCTNDIKGLPEWGVAYAAMVTVKGAMVSDLRVVRRDGDLLLDLEPGQFEKVRGFLDQYLISEDAELHDGREDVGVIGLVGPRAYEVVAAAFGLSGPPEPVRRTFAPPGQQPTLDPKVAGFEPRTVTLDGATLALMPSLLTRGEGVDLLVPRALLERVWTLLGDRGAAMGLHDAGVEALEPLRVEDGVPRFGVDLLETTIPLEAELLHAMSYNKGCYVGQEVIARATFRGHMNRKLVGLSLGAEPAGAPGQELRVDGKKVGFVTSRVRSPSRGETIGLGYVHRAHLAPGTVLQLGETDRTATVVALPMPKTR
ncbi:MAG: folate-binding protein YgfZ [Myxococcaceae bacterium]|nr:folate-binding protein YgfZ [Myxococcaceae bacterium]